MASSRKYKCPYCDNRYDREKLINHIDKHHQDMVPDDSTPTRVVFNLINKRTTGYCRVCNKETKWREDLGRYDVLCDNPKCKEALRRQYQENMIRTKGTDNILNDPEQQKKMLAARKISGSYKFRDGGVLTYTGSYEKECLEFMDKVLDIPSKDILSPGPTIIYKYKDEDHVYIPDFYLIPQNLIIEVKDGGNNPNTRNSNSDIDSHERTLAKENAIRKTGKYNYIRLTNNQFSQLINVLMEIKKTQFDKINSVIMMVNESHIIGEACKDVVTARKFVKDVGKLAKKYNANYFIVTDGASGTHNDGSNSIVRHMRDEMKDWERNNGFNPDEDWANNIHDMSDYRLKEASNDLFDDILLSYNKSKEQESMMESVINKNLEYNLDKWKPNGKNILFITGLSGSGKSTLAAKMANENDAVNIEMDLLEHNYILFDKNTNNDEGNLIIREFLEKKYNGPHKYNISNNNDFANDCESLVKHIIQYANKNKDKLFIVEGIQIMDNENGDVYYIYDIIKNYPIIVVNTSTLKSFLQARKRDKDNYIKPTSFKELIQDIKKWSKFYGDMSKSKKGFVKQINNESFIEQSINEAGINRADPNWKPSGCVIENDLLNDLSKNESYIHEVDNTDPDDRESVFLKTKKILKDNDIPCNVSDESIKKFINYEKDDVGGYSLCIAVGTDNVDKAAELVNPTISKYGGKLTPDNYGTVFLSLHESIDSEYLENNDSYYNIDNWGKTTNILWVTGLSGSGKTTLAKDLAKANDCYRVELDYIAAYYMMKTKERGNGMKFYNLVKEECPLAVGFFNLYASDTYGYPIKWGDTKDIINDFLKWFIPLIENQDKLCIINGAQIVEQMDVEYFYDKPIIIKDSSWLKSSFRRASREMDYDGSYINRLLSFINKYKIAFKKSYIDAMKKHNEFDKQMSKHTK